MKTVPLGEAIELVYGKSLPVRQRQPGAVPVYGANGEVGEHNIPVVEHPTVIVGRKGSAGAVHLVTRPCFPIDTTYYVRPRQGIELDMEYVAYALRHIDLSRIRTSTGVPGLTREDAYREWFPLPPIEEQRRIVDILNRAASIERLRAAASERLRAFIPALFIEMFGEPVENPTGWPVKPLGEVADVQGGLQVTKKRATHPLERPYLRVANVLRDQLVLDEIKTIRLTERELQRVQLYTGDLLIVEGHGNADEIGRVAVWDGRISECVHQNYLIRARVDQDVLLPVVANSYLNSSHGRQHLLKSGRTTSGLNTISTSDVKTCPITLPPLELQKQFADIVEATRATTRTADTAAETASALSRSLMSKLFAEDAHAAVPQTIIPEEREAC